MEEMVQMHTDQQNLSSTVRSPESNEPRLESHLIGLVASPGGVTEAILEVLGPAIDKALEAGRKRAAELAE